MIKLALNIEQRVLSRPLVKIPKELFHAGGTAGKVGAAETALLQLGPVWEGGWELN